MDRERTKPTYLREERELLSSWLDFHRATLLAKCEGLTDEQRKAQAISGSHLSLHGLVRHLAEVERNWFRRVLLRDDATPSLWYDRSLVGSPFVPLQGAVWEEDLRIWKAECDESRRAAAVHSMDDTGMWRGREISLRAIMVHMVQEYARHNGHADILRELEDGSVGV